MSSQNGSNSPSSDQQGQSRELSHPADAPPPNTLQLGPSKQLNLEGLTEDQRRELLMKYAEGHIALNQKAQEAALDIQALGNTLGTLSQNTREIAATGSAVTVAHTQDSSLGRTEVLMGTSAAAKVGKLSKTQTGGSGCVLAVLVPLTIALLSSWAIAAFR